VRAGGGFAARGRDFKDWRRDFPPRGRGPGARADLVGPKIADGRLVGAVMFPKASMPAPSSTGKAISRSAGFFEPGASRAAVERLLDAIDRELPRRLGGTGRLRDDRDYGLQRWGGRRPERRRCAKMVVAATHHRNPPRPLSSRYPPIEP
jgi:hypothetical protein